MRHLIKSALVACALLALPGFASASDGFATTNVNMRSGPSTAYPAVVVIKAGAPLNVIGCLADTPWCDVAYGRVRGWVAGRYIQVVYRQNRVYVAPDYYEPLGIPTIQFDIDTYWDRNYRKRDFYHDRDRWRRDYRSGERRRYERNNGEFGGIDRDRDRRRWERNIDRGSDDFKDDNDVLRDNRRWRDNNDGVGDIDLNRRDRHRNNDRDDNDQNRVDNSARDQERQREREERRKRFQDEDGNWKGFDQDGPRTLRCKPGMEGCS